MTSTTGYCSLHAAVGCAELCPGHSCAFWDTSAGSCVFADVTHELRTPLARHLLDLRGALERGNDTDRSRFFHLLNEEQEGGATAV
jgi:hypothetical protein